MSVVLSEHLPLLASAPDGIQKLRGLILELAVRGKLVPQDPNDEPASELLKRIAKVRARLEAEGSCKKSKATPLDSEGAPPFELPAGWALSQLSDLTLVLNGRAYSKDELLSEGVPVLRVGNLFTSNHWYYSNLQLEDDKYCDQGDLLYSWSASFGPFIWQGPKVIYHYHIWKLRLFDESSLSKEFFYKFLLEKTAEIKAAGHGVSMIHMTKEKMEKILVPIPPFAEQHRIVAKVDELMALCDRLESEVGAGETAHARLVETLLGTLTQSTDAAELAANWQRLAEHFDTFFTTEASLDALKQTILQLAVMGKLVPQDPNDEPAKELLKRIAKERARLEAEGRIKKSQPVPSVGEDELPFEVPPTWAWVRLSDVTTKITDGTHHSPPNLSAGDFKYISAKNIKRWGIDQSGMTFVTKEIHKEIYSRCNPERGDILYIKDGATTGIAAINTLDEPFSMLSSVALLKPSIGLFNRYLYFLMSSPLFYDEMRAGMTGVAITRVTLAKLNVALLPLPPLPEQHRIVTKVDELMALCDRLKADLADSRTRQARLSTTLIDAALEAA
ncbi:MAG: restriction endonuclease subunit S [Betaproteobacteria bacterium]|nr:restriction endonuclease subunit S [Betaproteobacteria bacterium]